MLLRAVLNSDTQYALQISLESTLNDPLHATCDGRVNVYPCAEAISRDSCSIPPIPITMNDDRK